MNGDNSTEKGAHTPGPWGVSDAGTSRGSVMVSAGSAGKWRGMIAQADAGNYARSQSEGVANAHLIAAAPDLLALAKQYASECSGCDGCGRTMELAPDGQPLHDVPCPDCADIRAVIAKAEGR